MQQEEETIGMKRDLRCNIKTKERNVLPNYNKAKEGQNVPICNKHKMYFGLSMPITVV